MAGEGGIPGFPTSGLDAFEFLGRGGSATVYRATDLALQREIAVKVLSPTPFDPGVPTEALAQAIVSWHTNVVSLYGHGRTDAGSTYLILELAEGGSLQELVQRSGPLNPRKL